ncbi:MAG: hypothetical protein H6693_02410 [Candidatus Latescibacteria bacterium]|nr:hypothetical protein [Candidatus Latescibacterota bacterium]
MRATPRRVVLSAPRRLLGCAALLFLALGPAVAAEPAPLTVEDIPTNLGLAHRMATEVAAATLDALSLPAGGCVLLKARGEHSGNSILELALAEAARQRGLAIAAADAGCPTTLEYRILELQIAYTGVDRSALWTRKEIERHGACVLAARVLETEGGRERATTQQEVLLADRVPYDLKDLVGSPTYPFTAPELKERDWSKSAEPFVVTGMIAGLIYLFFSNQSGN